jgi:hypothetical protein
VKIELPQQRGCPPTPLMSSVAVGLARATENIAREILDVAGSKGERLTRSARDFIERSLQVNIPAALG